jgi:hypothetical protein
MFFTFIYVLKALQIGYFILFYALCGQVFYWPLMLGNVGLKTIRVVLRMFGIFTGYDVSIYNDQHTNLRAGFSVTPVGIAGTLGYEFNGGRFA